MNFLILFLIYVNISLCQTNENIIENCNNRGLYDKEEKKCICIDSFISISDNEKECVYAKRSKTTAILLSIFGGFFGADQFYLGKNFKGFMKTLIPFLTFTVLVYLKLTKNEKIKFPNTFFLIPVFVMLCLWLIDLLLLLSNKTKDSFGLSLS